MNAERQQAITYLRAPSDGFWRWSEDGGVLVWRDGATIAFKQEVEQILQWLQPNGLPPFGAIVFLLAATRGKFPNINDIVAEKPPPLNANANSTDALTLAAARKQLRAQLESAIQRLNSISKLPPELQSGIKARCLLAEAVFETARAERHFDACAILAGLREPISDEDLVDAEGPGLRVAYVRQIHMVAEGLKPHTVDSLTLRLQTGLDALPSEIDINLPSAERARRLIEELSRDKDFGAVARAARELMAAVRLPRRLGERDQLALGGVSDITNRGPLDRLLISELAHDDLTLSVRVALNEALYLRREPPMREPPGTLAVLLDSGVRLWGIPRLLAAAVALALVARDKQHCAVAAWRAARKQLQPVDLLTRKGLTQHLGALETDPHPGEALRAFSEVLAASPDPQAVLITHRDVLDDPEFRRLLAAAPNGPSFIASVDRAGRFELHAMPLARRSPICAADLDVNAIFAEAPRVAPVNVEIDPNLPAIFGVRPFPFLLPLSGKIENWTKNAEGKIHAVLNDRRIVQFRNQQKGGRELAHEIPGGATLWMEELDGVLHIVKAGSTHRPVRLLSYARADESFRVLDLGAGATAAHRDGNVILLIRPHDVRAFSLSDGSQLGRAANPFKWIRGRYFRSEKSIQFVQWDGQSVRFEPISLPRQILLHHVQTVFDRDGLEGPWLYPLFNYFISTASREEIKIPTDSKQDAVVRTEISRDGHEALLFWRNKQTTLFSLKSRTIDTSPAARAQFDAAPSLPSWNLYRVIEAIAPLEDGLALRGRKNRWRKLFLHPNGTIRIADMNAVESAQLPSIAFGAPIKKYKKFPSLQLAEWASSSKAFLDSRGLLHLKSHDTALPEISIVLADGEAAAWTSDGLRCGPEFFFETQGTSQASEIFQRLLSFIQRL